MGGDNTFCIKDGDGTLVLAAGGARTGRTNVYAGTLRLQNANAAGSGEIYNLATLEIADTSISNRTILANGSTLRATGMASTINTVIVDDANVTITPGAGPTDSFTFGNFSNALNGSESAIINIGAGTAVSGKVVVPKSSNYQGSWFVNGGTLEVQHAQSLGTGPSSVTLNNGGTLEISGVTVSRPLVVNNGTTASAP